MCAKLRDHLKDNGINGKVVSLHTMKAYGGLEVWLCSFLTLGLDGYEWLDSCPVLFSCG